MKALGGVLALAMLDSAYRKCRSAGYRCAPPVEPSIGHAIDACDGSWAAAQHYYALNLANASRFLSLLKFLGRCPWTGSAPVSGFLPGAG